MVLWERANKLSYIGTWNCDHDSEVDWIFACNDRSVGALAIQWMVSPRWWANAGRTLNLLSTSLSTRSTSLFTITISLSLSLFLFISYLSFSLFHPRLGPVDSNENNLAPVRNYEVNWMANGGSVSRTPDASLTLSLSLSFSCSLFLTLLYPSEYEMIVLTDSRKIIG